MNSMNKNDKTVNSIGINDRVVLSYCEVSKINLPLILEWAPKEDITTYELALCLPYIFAANTNRPLMPSDIDLKHKFFRNFKVIDPNE